MDKKKIGNMVRKTCSERRRISSLKDVIKKESEEQVVELVECQMYGDILRMGF